MRRNTILSTDVYLFDCGFGGRMDDRQRALFLSTARREKHEDGRDDNSAIHQSLWNSLQLERKPGLQGYAASHGTPHISKTTSKTTSKTLLPCTGVFAVLLFEQLATTLRLARSPVEFDQNLLPQGAPICIGGRSCSKSINRLGGIYYYLWVPQRTQTLVIGGALIPAP
jgi:hypothetical protein